MAKVRLRFRLIHLLAFTTLFGIACRFACVVYGPMFFIPDKFVYEGATPIIFSTSSSEIKGNRTYPLSKSTLHCQMQLTEDTIVEIHSVAAKENTECYLTWADVVVGNTRRKVWETQCIYTLRFQGNCMPGLPSRHVLAHKQDNRFGVAFISGKRFFFADVNTGKNENTKIVVVKHSDGRKVLRHWFRKDYVNLYDATKLASVYKIKKLQWKDGTWHLEVTADKQLFTLIRSADGVWAEKAVESL